MHGGWPLTQTLRSHESPGWGCKPSTIESEPPTTFQALFASPGVSNRLVDLDDLVFTQAGLEPWIRLTVALTVFHEREDQVLWDSFEPLARQAGVRDFRRET